MFCCECQDDVIFIPEFIYFHIFGEMKHRNSSGKSAFIKANVNEIKNIDKAGYLSFFLFKNITDEIIKKFTGIWENFV